MTAIKLTFIRETNNGKHLLALIRDIAKSDKNILVEELDEPNIETQKAMKDAENGRVTMIQNIDELFDAI